MKKIYNFYKKALHLAGIFIILFGTCFSVMAQPMQFTGTWANLKNYIENLAAGSSVEIELANTPTDVNSTIVIQQNTSVTLRSDVGNRILEKTTPDRHFLIKSDAILTLEDITLDGGGLGGGISTGMSADGLRAELILNSGAIIQNCTNTGSAGFVNTDNSPNINVNVGGGVALYGHYSTINVNNGAIIRSNTAFEGNGGGIGVAGELKGATGASNCTVNINAGALISGNTATETLKTTKIYGNGGGVYVSAQNTVTTVSGATIQGNYASLIGGGIFSSASGFNNNNQMTLTVKENAIIGGSKWSGGTTGVDAAVGNYAGDGGGVFCAYGLTLGKCSIIGNMAGGLYSISSVNGSLIHANGTGGGIFYSGTGLLIQDGVIISNNTVEGGQGGGSGGGIYTNSGNPGHSMTGGIISGNTAASAGGGIHTAYSWNISGGTIQGNYAGKRGGGIYIMGNPVLVAELNVSGGTLIGGPTQWQGGTVGVNSAQGNYSVENGGGISIGAYANVVLGDCILSGNAAGINGGGVCDEGFDTSSISTGAKIINNEAAGNGGGFYKQCFVLNMTGGEISGNTAGGEGGGIYNTPTTAYSGVRTSMVNLHGGEIKGNTALRGGGIYSDAKADNSVAVNIDGATTISNNKATGAAKTVTTPPTTYSGDGGGGIYITNLNVLSVGSGVTFSGNTANKPYWLELSPEDTLYDAGTGALTAAQIMALSTSQIHSSVKFSTPPPCNFPFDYAYNNYDINYIGTTDNNEEIYYHEVCSNDSIIFLAVEEEDVKVLTYQWFLNRNPVAAPGKNDSTYTYKPNFNTTDTVYCIITADDDCAKPASTPKYIITIHEPPTLSLGIFGTDTAICDTLPVIISNNIFGGTASKIEKITVSGSLGGTVNWSMPDSPFSITYTPVGSDTGKTVVLTVTTDSIAPCSPAQGTIILHINAKSIINLDPKISDICSEETLNFTVDQANITGWTRAEVAGISNSEGSGTGNSVSETLINTTKTVIPVEYLFTINTNGCISTGKVTILVKPKVPIKAKIAVRKN